MLEPMTREEALAQHRHVAEELRKEVVRVVGPDLGRFIKVHELEIPDPDSLKSKRWRMLLSSTVSLGEVGTRRIDQKTWNRIAALAEVFESRHKPTPLEERLKAAGEKLSERDVTQGICSFDFNVTDTTPSGEFHGIPSPELSLRLLASKPGEHIRVRPGEPVWVIPKKTTVLGINVNSSYHTPSPWPK